MYLTKKSMYSFVPRNRSEDRSTSLSPLEERMSRPATMNDITMCSGRQDLPKAHYEFVAILKFQSAKIEWQSNLSRVKISAEIQNGKN